MWIVILEEACVIVMVQSPPPVRYQRFLLPAVLLIAFAFLLINYDIRLPVLDTDEGILLVQTFHDRGLGTYSVMSVRGYPPVIMGLFAGVQRAVEAITGKSAVDEAELIVRIVRLMAVIANLITVYLIYRIGTRLHSVVVGAATALVWAILPIVQAQMRLALTEPWQMIFVTASIWSMVQTLDRRSWRWALVGTIFGVGAVAAKYSIFTVLGLGVGATLWLAWKDNRRWLLVTLAQFGIIAFGAFLLLRVYGASTLADNPEPAEFVHSGLQNLLDPARVLYLFNVASAQVGAYMIGLLLLVLVVGTFLYFRRVTVDWRMAWTFILIFALIHVWLVSSFLVWDPLKDRYISPASSALVLLIVTSLVTIGNELSRRMRVRAFVPVALLLAIWAIPPLVSRVQEIVMLSYPSTERAFVDWSAASLEPGTLAIDGLEGQKWFWRLFNPIWGGYYGPQRPLVESLVYANAPLDKFKADGVQYIHLTGNYPGDDPPLALNSSQMVFLKAFPPPDSQQHWQGDPFYIYRVGGIQHSLSVMLGDSIQLDGYDLNTAQVKPGDTLTVRLYWQAVQRPTADDHLYLHLSSLNTHDALAQADGTPALPTRPTYSWDDPHETLISPQYTITIPADLAPGGYRLLAGLYDFASGQRLPTPEGDYVTLSNITVIP